MENLLWASERKAQLKFEYNTLSFTGYIKPFITMNHKTTMKHHHNFFMFTYCFVFGSCVPEVFNFKEK